MPLKTTKATKNATGVTSKATKATVTGQKPSKAPQQQPTSKSRVVSNAGNVSKSGKIAKKCSSQKGTPKSKPVKSDVIKGETKEDKAAIKIQSMVRAFLGRITASKKREELANYEALMEQLEKEAWLSIVKREKEEAERERQKEERERKRKAAERKRQQLILEASFDGDLPAITQVLNEAAKSERDENPSLSGKYLDFAIQNHMRKLIDCEDANGNTPLSEAAAGGDTETINFLINHGADVNARGAFRRTPLYRAAFAGHVEAVECLLENGGDPRLYDADGSTPDQIAAVAAISDIMKEWDLTETDRVCQLNQKRIDDWKTNYNAFAKEETEKTEGEISRAEEEYKKNQKQLRKAYEELNKRIFEHDKCALVDGSKAEITLKMIHDAEEELARWQSLESESRQKLAMLRLQLRDQRGIAASETDLVAKMGITCHIRELDDVLIRDVGDKIQNDGRWPLLVDSSSQACTFLRYRDTNYIQALNPKDMEAEVLRKALLGAIRYGKPFVVDMMEVDMLDFLKEKLSNIKEDLYQTLISREIIRNEKFMDLVRPSDGDEYKKAHFLDNRVAKFKFVLISKIWNPPEEWLTTFYPVRIVTSSR